MLTHNLPINHEVITMRSNNRWVRVNFRNHQNFWLQVFDHFIGLLKVQRRLDGAINNFHAKRMERRQCLKKRKIGLSEDDRVVWIGTIKFNQVDDVTEAQTWMTAKYYARLENEINKYFYNPQNPESFSPVETLR